VTLHLEEGIQDNRDTNLADLGQNRMAVGRPMRRYPVDIGLHNTQVAGTMMLQWFENTELRMCDQSRAEQYV
jgi:hypothetical protein